MQIPSLPRLRPGQTPTAADWNALVEFLSVTQGSAVGSALHGDVGVSRSGGGLVVNDAREKPHWAQLTARGTGNAYTHHQVAPNGDGTFTDLPDDDADYMWGDEDSAPAREVNGRVDFDSALPVYVQLWPDPTGPGFLFRYEAGGPSSPPLLCEVTAYNSSTKYHTVKQLERNASTHAIEDTTGPTTYATCLSTTGGQIPNTTRVIIEPIPGTSDYWATPDATYATVNIPGLMSHITQSFTGFKSFTYGANILPGVAGTTAQDAGFLPHGTTLALPTSYAANPGAYAPKRSDDGGAMNNAVLFVGDENGFSRTVGAYYTTVGGTTYQETWFVDQDSGAVEAAVWIFTGRLGWYDAANSMGSGSGYVWPGADTDVGIGMRCRGGMVLTEGLSDPDADRIAFWDDSAGSMAWLTPSGLTITATTLTTDGITDTRSFTDAGGNSHSVTIVGGRVTDWTVTPPP